MDEECAICCALQVAANSLMKIVDCIDYSCEGQSTKRDFGLERNFVAKEVNSIKQMQKLHEYYHSTGEALNDSESMLDLPLMNDPRPQRFRGVEE